MSPVKSSLLNVLFCQIQIILNLYWFCLLAEHAIYLHYYLKCLICSTLPAKPAEEQRRHRAQYLALIEAAKRKEARRARQRKQFLEMKRKEEDEAAAAVRLWSVQILPNWEHMYVSWLHFFLLLAA